MSKIFNPDNATLKDKIIHASGGGGGMLVGNRHSASGIKALNKSTGEFIEMEGGEVVITRNAVSDKTKRNFNGEMLTNRQILSKINASGGGITFAEHGAELPKEILCCGEQYEYGGEMHSDYDIMNLIYNTGGELSVLEVGLNNEAETLCSDLECDGSTKILSKFLADNGISHRIFIGELSRLDDGNIDDYLFPHQWIELINKGEKIIVDYKARLWLGSEAPHGVITKDKLNGFLYEGQEMYVNPRVKEILYKIQKADL